MDRRRCSPGRRSARLAAIAVALSALAVCASPHGGWLAPVPVLAHKAPLPTPLPTSVPVPTLLPTPTPEPTPTPTAKPVPTSQPSPTAGHRREDRPSSAPAPAADATPADSAPPSAAATQHAAARTPGSTRLEQQASVPTTLASYAEDRQGRLSGYVMGADILAGVSVLGSLVLAELRRRRLV